MKLFSFSSINVVRRMLEGACVYLLSSITVNQVYGRSHKFIRKKVQTIFSGRISLIRIFQAGSLLGFNFHTILLRLCKWRFCKSSTQSRCGTATYAKPADLRTYFLSLVKVFSVCRKLTRVMKMTAFKLF